jgi:hypothetical protein
MSRYKIQLTTFSDAAKLAAAAERLEMPIFLTDGAGMKVSAKSVMGAIYSLEFEEIWLESDEDIPYMNFSEFIV